MKKIALLLVLILFISLLGEPVEITAENNIEHSKGEMITIYDCADSRAFNARLSEDKLFFMTSTDTHFKPTTEKCLTYDLDTSEYLIIHEVEERSTLRSGYSWKTCMNNDYVFWQEWSKGENDESIHRGYISNLDNKSSKVEFEFTRDNPRISISNDNLFVHFHGKRISNTKSENFALSLENTENKLQKLETKEGLYPQSMFVISDNRIILTKRITPEESEFYIYNISTDELLQVTDENHHAVPRTASLQGDYLFYFSEDEVMMSYHIPTGKHVVAIDLDLKNKKDNYKLLRNPNAHYAVTIISTTEDSTYGNEFENYILLYDPETGKTKQIHLSDTRLTLWAYLDRIPAHNTCWGKKLVFEIPEEYDFFCLYDGETDTISKIDIDGSYRWYINDLQIHGDTIVWEECFHGRTKGRNCPARLKMFKLK